MAARGSGSAETIAAMEGLGYGCPDNGLIFAINASLWTVAIPILLHGTDDQKRTILTRPLPTARRSGPTARASPRRAPTSSACGRRAVRISDGWVLDGRKTWVTSGPVADLFVCYASTEPRAGG